MKSLSKALATTCLSLACFLPVSTTLAAPVSDQTQPTISQTNARISINTANAETIALTLNGIGEAKAQRIVAWRESNGRFENVEQLLEIKGIGQATLDKNIDLISL